MPCPACVHKAPRAFRLLCHATLPAGWGGTGNGGGGGVGVSAVHAVLSARLFPLTPAIVRASCLGLHVPPPWLDDGICCCFVVVVVVVVAVTLSIRTVDIAPACDLRYLNGHRYFPTGSFPGLHRQKIVRRLSCERFWTILRCQPWGHQCQFECSVFVTFRGVWGLLLTQECGGGRTSLPAGVMSVTQT